MNIPRRNIPSGFTLMELIVSISVIGIISAISIIGIKEFRKQVRDARRLADMKNLATAIQTFVRTEPNTIQMNNDTCSDISSYPDHNTWDRSDQGTQQWPFIPSLSNLGFGPYFGSHTPVDPLNIGGSTCCNKTTDYLYAFRAYQLDALGCTGKKFWLLGASNFETVNGKHPASPGFRCNGTPQQNEIWDSINNCFEYLTGDFY